jgi:hypothetical protein
MSNPLRVASAAALVGCLFAVSAYAQDVTPPSAAPANLAYIEGVVDVTQSGVTEPADPPLMLIEGDVIRTRNGRAEIVFGDGTLLHLANDTELEVLGDERLRLVSGRAIVRLSSAAARPYVIDTPSSSIRLDAQGEYGLTADRGGRLELTVGRGAATVLDARPWEIRGGQMLSIGGVGARPLISSFNSARWDAFAAWSHDRTNGLTASASAAQLPYELRPYGPTLDRYGRWDYVAPYGNVWFPSVGSSWRPYYEGSWAFTRYGWTWQGRDRWAWPTHHYGRWEFNGAFWFWVPASSWAPAWVTWSVAPGYVSWAPLGWYTQRRFDGWDRRDHPAYAPDYSPWRGWTVLPRNQFAPRRNVRTYAVDGDRLDEATRRALLTRATPSRPAEAFAVPRAGADQSRQPIDGNVRRPRPSSPPSGDGPAYTPPASWSGAARGSNGRSDRGAKDDDTERSTAAPAPAARAPNRGDSDRRGADRDPGARSAPRSAPKSEAPAARQPQSHGKASGAAVRPPGARPKG